MNLSECKRLIISDVYRYSGKKNGLAFLKSYFTIPGFKYGFFLRLTLYLRSKFLLLLPLYFISRILLNHYKYKFGIDISYDTQVGSGLYIGHFGGIVVNYKTKIGKNCNINHGVTIGETFGGKNPGVPEIGDDVYIGPGSIIIGGIKVGNSVAIGAHSVVTQSIPDCGVVVGNPARIISMKGSGIYVSNIDY